MSSHGGTCCRLVKFPSWSPISLQLVSPCDFGKPTAGSFLTGWWAVQNANLSWIMPVHPCASPAMIARWKAPFLLEIGLRAQVWHSSRQMAYYLRYTTERKEVALGFSLLWLVTFELKHVVFSKIRLAWAISYSFQVWLYYLTLLVCLQLRSTTPCFIVITESIFITSWMLVLSFISPSSHPISAKQVKAFSDQALKLILIPKFPLHGKTSFPNLGSQTRESHLLLWLFYLKKS
jgi:hypothetical protein